MAGPTQLNGKGDDAHRLASFLVRELRGEIAREDRLSRLRSVLPLFLNHRGQGHSFALTEKLLLFMGLIRCCTSVAELMTSVRYVL